MDSDNVFSRSTVDGCRIIDLPRNTHPNGSLTAMQNDGTLPFTIKRVYYLYDIPGDAARGGHAHKENQSLLVALSGSFEVHLGDGVTTRTFFLNRPYNGLYVPAGLWREIDNFSSGSVCLVLTSDIYDESDYVRSIDEFRRLTAGKRI